MIIMQNLVLIFAMNMITRCHSETHKMNASALDGEKKILRYGFHKTQDCLNFELAFLCIQKCLDLGFDVAHADKECLCTCFYNRAKGQYKTNNIAKMTKWRLGAPTTKHPAWILPYLPNEQMQNGDVDSEHSEEGKNDDLNSEDHNQTLNSDDTVKNDTVSGNGEDSKPSLDNNSANGTVDGGGTVDEKGTTDGNGTVGEKGTADDGAADAPDGNGAAEENGAAEDNGGAAE